MADLKMAIKSYSGSQKSQYHIVESAMHDRKAVLPSVLLQHMEGQGLRLQ